MNQWIIFLTKKCDQKYNIHVLISVSITKLYFEQKYGIKTKNITIWLFSWFFHEIIELITNTPITNHYMCVSWNVWKTYTPVIYF